MLKTEKHSTCVIDVSDNDRQQPSILLSNGGERNGWCVLALDKFINIERAESKNTKRKNLTETKQTTKNHLKKNILFVNLIQHFSSKQLPVQSH